MSSLVQLVLRHWVFVTDVQLLVQTLLSKYPPIFDGLDALDSVRLAVLLYVGVDARIMSHEVRLREAVRHCAELERRRQSSRVFQLSTRIKSKLKLATLVSSSTRNLAIANRSRVSCAHNQSTASIQ